MRGMCVVMIPVMIQFPAAILTYWLTSNLFSTCQVLILKIPAVKQRLGIPIVPPSTRTVPTQPLQGSFWGNLKKAHKEAVEVVKQEAGRKKSTRRRLESHEYTPRLEENEKLFEKGRKRASNRKT